MEMPPEKDVRANSLAGKGISVIPVSRSTHIRNDLIETNAPSAHDPSTSRDVSVRQNREGSLGI